MNHPKLRCFRPPPPHFHCSIFSRKVRRKWQNATHDSGPDSGYALLKPIMRVVAIWLEFCNVKGSKTMVIKNRIRNLRECKKQFKHLHENSRCYGVVKWSQITRRDDLNDRKLTALKSPLPYVLAALQKMQDYLVLSYSALYNLH